MDQSLFLSFVLLFGILHLHILHCAARARAWRLDLDFLGSLLVWSSHRSKQPRKAAMHTHGVYLSLRLGGVSGNSTRF